MMTTEEQSEQLALLWETLIMRNEINICTDQLNGTSVLDVNILRVVEKNPEIMIRDIGITLGTSNSTLSSGIKRLEKKGLIARHISKQDLRSYVIVLTEQGDKAIKEHFRKEKELMARLLDAFPLESEKETFLELFSKLVNHVVEGK